MKIVAIVQDKGLFRGDPKVAGALVEFGATGDANQPESRTPARVQPRAMAGRYARREWKAPMKFSKEPVRWIGPS